MERPNLPHLRGFQDDRYWIGESGEDLWQEYLRRRAADPGGNARDQRLHRLLGRLSRIWFLPWDEEWWHAREAAQWDRGSGTGPWDHLEDEINWLRGAGRLDEANELLRLAQAIRSDFMASGS